MSQLIIKPNFNRINQQIAFPSSDLNYFMREEVQDSFGFYQANFGVYSYMTLNKNLNYVIHTIGGSPLMWQPHNSCGWNETGSLGIGRREFTPCRAKINESFCYDELFEGCFEHFLSWPSNRPIELDSDGIDMVNKLVRTMVEQATIGARLTLTAGQLYDVANVTFNTNTSANIRDLFEKTVGSCQGWVELVRTMALQFQYEHLDLPNIFSVADFNGKEYIGDVTQLYDDLKAAAKPELRQLIDEGGFAGSVEGSDFQPLFLVSSSIHSRIALEYNTLCVAVTCINPRITKEDFTVSTTRGSRTIKVYYIDNVPVVPISDINCYDKYLTGATHFAAITASGNIGLGASFDSMPFVGGNEVGILIQQETSAKDYGRYYFLAHALFAATIADTNYFVGTQEYAEP